MDKFVQFPRQQPPKPKDLNIEPPKFAVPEVTLMFDSDDSLIWKPGETPGHQSQTGKIISQFPKNAFSKHVITEQCTYDKENRSPLKNYSNCKDLYLDAIECLKPENVPTNQRKSCFPEGNLTTNFSSISNSKKVAYNPESYASPTPSIRTSTKSCDNAKLAFTERNMNLNKEITNPSIGKFDNPALITKNAFQQHYQDNADDLACSYKVQFTSKEIDSSLPAVRPVSNKKGKTITETLTLARDQHILKLIEGQNQQILHLHKVLDNFLEKPNTNRGEPNNERHCRHCHSAKDEILTKKIAIVQTSFSEFEPKRKTVGTNTEVSWDELLQSLRNFEKNESKLVDQREFIDDGLSSRCPTTNKTNKIKGPVNSDNMRIFPNVVLQRDGCPGIPSQRDASFTLKDVAIETVFEPPSPEHSLHITIPEYQEDNFNQAIHWSDAEERTSNRDSPMVGDSASVYNERHNEEEMLLGIELPRDDNRITCINNVMICLQQYLQKTKQKEDELAEVAELPKVKDATNDDDGRNERQTKNSNKNLLNLHLQQFGISVLDSLGHGDNQRALVGLDSLCFSGGYFPGGCDLSFLQINQAPLQSRRRGDANYVIDSRLAAIAHTSSGNPLATLSSNERRQHQLENNFSFATRQFLGKYELDK